MCFKFEPYCCLLFLPSAPLHQPPSSLSLGVSALSLWEYQSLHIIIHAMPCATSATHAPLPPPPPPPPPRSLTVHNLDREFSPTAKCNDHSYTPSKNSPRPCSTPNPLMADMDGEIQLPFYEPAGEAADATLKKWGWLGSVVGTVKTVVR